MDGKRLAGYYSLLGMLDGKLGSNSGNPCGYCGCAKEAPARSLISSADNFPMLTILCSDVMLGKGGRSFFLLLLPLRPGPTWIFQLSSLLS